LKLLGVSTQWVVVVFGMLTSFVIGWTVAKRSSRRERQAVDTAIESSS
jgi:hypothetical protein